MHLCTLLTYSKTNFDNTRPLPSKQCWWGEEMEPTVPTLIEPDSDLPAHLHQPTWAGVGCSNQSTPPTKSPTTVSHLPSLGLG